MKKPTEGIRRQREQRRRAFSAFFLFSALSCLLISSVLCVFDRKTISYRPRWNRSSRFAASPRRTRPRYARGCLARALRASTRRPRSRWKMGLSPRPGGRCRRIRGSNKPNTPNLPNVPKWLRVYDVEGFVFAAQGEVEMIEDVSTKEKHRVGDRNSTHPINGEPVDP